MKEARIISTEEALKIPIDIYNKAVELEWEKKKEESNLSGSLRICKHCNRKNVIACICPKGQDDWNNIIEEVKNVSERDRTGE